MIIADNFFDSSTFTLARNLTGFFVVVFWLATAFWVYKDARRRIDDPWLVAMAAVLGLVPPFVGPIVYLFLRPPDSIEERRDRELENRALEERLAERDLRCPVCRGEVDASFLVCPVCTTRLKQACGSCGSPLEQIWQVCPYCATPVPPAARLGDEVAAAAARPPHELMLAQPAGRRRVAATTLPRLWLPKPHSSSSSRTASVAHSAARSSPASSVAATSCAAPAS